MSLHLFKIYKKNEDNNANNCNKGLYNFQSEAKPKQQIQQKYI